MKQKVKMIKCRRKECKRQFDGVKANKTIKTVYLVGYCSQKCWGADMKSGVREDNLGMNLVYERNRTMDTVKCSFCKRKLDEKEGDKWAEFDQAHDVVIVCIDCAQKWSDEEKTYRRKAFLCRVCNCYDDVGVKGVKRVCDMCADSIAEMLSRDFAESEIKNKEGDIEVIEAEILALQWRLIHEKFVEVKHGTD